MLAVKEKCSKESLIILEQVLKGMFESEIQYISNWHNNPTERLRSKMGPFNLE